MLSKKFVVVVMLLLVASAGAYAVYWYMENSGPPADALPDTAAAAFIEAASEQDAKKMRELLTQDVSQEVADEFSRQLGEALTPIEEACGGLDPVGSISSVVEQGEDTARVHTTVTYDCPDQQSLEYLDAELELVREGEIWRVFIE
ncbi:MAG: hypothetical protein D6E12_06250 [Desulfovibrio sp.]|nr:MAG: hypothetical protein D6E12_06250 [Desulfovibrio sp.]